MGWAPDLVNITIDLKEIGCEDMDWIKWLADVYPTVNLRVP